jgi:hypothetical protein
MPESVAILLGEVAKWHGFERFRDDILILAVEFQAASDGDAAGNGSLKVSAASVSPNPLNPEATLTFTTSKPGNVKAEMFDLHGRAVRTIIGPTHMTAGRHERRIDGRGENGDKLASGVYLLRGTTADGAFKNTITILK